MCSHYGSVNIIILILSLNADIPGTHLQVYLPPSSQLDSAADTAVYIRKVGIRCLQKLSNILPLTFHRSATPQCYNARIFSYNHIYNITICEYHIAILYTLQFLDWTAIVNLISFPVFCIYSRENTFQRSASILTRLAPHNHQIMKDT